MKFLRCPSPPRVILPSDHQAPLPDNTLTRGPVPRSVLLTLLRVYLAILVLFLLLPLAAAAQQPDQRSWAGNWLVVSERDQQLVWQLNEDGSGFAYGFLPNGKLSHGFAINWRLDGDRVSVRTGASVRCSDGVVAVAFTGWSAATLNFAIVDGRNWLQANGSILSFQRRLHKWSTPRAGGECPNLAT
ncbi:hypothetical protein [Microbulbifer discodermiae]|uniref:hypothetical protein n=1 Tax=Microbulbifer sp. 2201CG32-9 TaxID=3232309 RepID=UPI00345BD31C